MSIIHYAHRPGFYPGVPGEVGAGQIIETEDDGTTILSIRPMGTAPEGEAETTEGMEATEGAEATTRAGRKQRQVGPADTQADG